MTDFDWTEAAVKKWWYRMGEIFGTRWYETNGPEASNLWQQSITEWTLERAAAVIEHYRVCGASHPPTMSEVVHLARSLKLDRGYSNAPRIEDKREFHPTVTKFVEKAREKIRPHRPMSILLPGEGYGDYLDAMGKSGMTKEKFDEMRLSRFYKKDEAAREREAIQSENV